MLVIHTALVSYDSHDSHTKDYWGVAFDTETIKKKKREKQIYTSLFIIFSMTVYVCVYPTG